MELEKFEIAKKINNRIEDLNSNIRELNKVLERAKSPFLQRIDLRQYDTGGDCGWIKLRLDTEMLKYAYIKFLEEQIKNCENEIEFFQKEFNEL